MIIRVVKGFYMFWMFVIFGLGICFELTFVLPGIWALQLLLGHDPSRMQYFHRKLFAFWLWLLRVGGLLKSKPHRGTIYNKPCIVIANHPGLFDVLYLIRDIPHMSVLVKRALVKYLPLRPIFHASGYVLSSDALSGSPFESLLGAIDILKMGYKFLLFPEGTRSPEGGLGPFRSGAFKVAQNLRVPVQPVFIKNTPPFLSKGAPWYLPPRKISEIEIEFWEPVFISKEDNVRGIAKEIEDHYRKALLVAPGRDQGSY